MHLSTIRLSAAALLVAASVAACGSSGAASSPADTAGAAPAATAAADAGASTSAAPASTGTISANDASPEEIVAALTAAGVPNAERWAREIQEYRPYPADDPTLQRLQDNLAKYNPDPATLAGILSVLHP